MARDPNDDIIGDIRVFDDSYDDVELLYRKEELSELRSELTGDSDGHVLLTGSSGVGKSLFAKKSIDQINSYDNTSFDRVQVNCFGKTTTAIKRELVENHHNGPDEIPKTTAESDVEEELETALDGETVVVLDEANKIHQTDIIRDLDEIPEITIVAIAHDLNEWMHQHKMRYGNIHFEHIPLSQFSTQQLGHILERRARQGFHNMRVISKEQLENIADEVGGIARQGIQRLWAAADVAADSGHHNITDDDIAAGEPRAMTRIRQMRLESLPYHHQVLYAIIQERGEVTGTDLHARYNEVAADVYHDVPAEPIRERTRRQKFPKLKQYDLITTRGSTQGTIYEVVDADVEPEKIELPDTPSPKSV